MFVSLVTAVLSDRGLPNPSSYVRIGVYENLTIYYMINEIVTEKLFARPCNLVSQLVQEALFIKLVE